MNEEGLSEGEVTLGIAQQHELLLDSIDREDEVDLLEISAFLNSLVEAALLPSLTNKILGNLCWQRHRILPES